HADTLSVAQQRAATVGAYVRRVLATIRPNARVVELATTAAQLYAPPEEPASPPHDAVAQVLLAGNVEVWRWTGNHLVRAPPRVKLPYSLSCPRECVPESERGLLPDP